MLVALFRVGAGLGGGSRGAFETRATAETFRASRNGSESKDEGNQGA
ncbi:hypothetical protein [Deinococcus saxicola]